MAALHGVGRGDATETCGGAKRAATDAVAPRGPNHQPPLTNH